MDDSDGIHADVPGWLGLLRVYRYEKGRKNRPYPIREIAVHTGLPYAMVKKTFDGVIIPSPSMIEKIMVELDVPASDAASIRRDFVPQPSNDFPLLEFRTDAQILADAINNLADAIRAHAVEGPRERRTDDDQRDPAPAGSLPPT